MPPPTTRATPLHANQPSPCRMMPCYTHALPPGTRSLFMRIITAAGRLEEFKINRIMTDCLGAIHFFYTDAMETRWNY